MEVTLNDFDMRRCVKRKKWIRKEKTFDFPLKNGRIRLGSAVCSFIILVVKMKNMKTSVPTKYPDYEFYLYIKRINTSPFPVYSR